MIPYPDNEYLLKLGRCVYAMAYLEALPLGDFERLSQELPNDMTIERFSALTTGALSQKLSDSCSRIHNAEIREYVEQCHVSLQNLLNERNSVVHSRPATIGERQRLYRWVFKSGKVESGEISDDFLSTFERKILHEISEVLHKRPP